MYTKELQALKRASRYRSRTIYEDDLLDFASNDYLGLSYKTQLFRRASTQVQRFACHGPKASQMVNGYHPLHKEFEAFLCRQNNFQSAILAGSGFLANLALIESLPRKGDILILDEEYHASGNLASKLVDTKVLRFRHNDVQHLQELLEKNKFYRAIVAVEGIYSMSGDIVPKELFEVCQRDDTILIVDEAHSSGVLGQNLLGIFDHYAIEPQHNHVKMGTLGKAYGSYGAYILASEHIVEFLQNRAKSLIYATAPSIFDIALGHQGMLYILKHKKDLRALITQRQNMIRNYFSQFIEGLVFPLEVKSATEALDLQEKLKAKGFLVGAIRPPTVERSILRIIPRVDIPLENFEKLCLILQKELEL